MFAEMGIAPSAEAVAQRYSSFLDGFVFDQRDHALQPRIEALGITPYLTDILMRDRMDRCRLAEEVLEFGRSLRGKSG
jgi:LPPG:FO 2-phospho-L-lactate transferase